MATPTRGKKARPFPALVIASLLLLACLYPGQYLISQLAPGISGQATISPSLIIFDIPIRLPFSIDVILVAALFFFVYAAVILVFPSGLGGTTWRQTLPRLGAVAVGMFFFFFAAATTGLISYLVHDHLPRNVRNGIDSLGIAADVSLPFSGTVHLPGNVITLLGLIIGFAIVVAKIGSTPGKRKTAPLTREQRMTPYARMQREKKLVTTDRHRASVKPATARSKKSTRQSPAKPITEKPLCQNQPLHTLEPEAVAYMPIG